MQRLLYTTLTLLCCAQVFAQAPQGITYQAVARGNAGNVLPDSALTVRMGILLDSPSGDLLWQETHAVNTNFYGLFDLVIGQGDGTGAVPMDQSSERTATRTAQNSVSCDQR